jgi:zinc/manganese transport system permease protein
MSPISLHLEIVAPAFLAGLLVLATHVPLGQQVLARGIVFIDLAIAQTAALGVIAADSLGWEPQGWRVQAAACAAALLGALLLTATERLWPAVQEALIGVMFVAAACVELLLLANNPHGGEHLKDLLAGQILWVAPADLVPVAILYAGVLALWFGMRARLGSVGFYLLFAVTVTQSVQLVGIYLVFASLIVPALAARILGAARPLAASYALGIAGYAAGLIASALFDLPTGPVVVCALVAGLAAAAVPAMFRTKTLSTEGS